MGVYYKFIRPWDMKVIAEGKYSGMPFFRTDIPIPDNIVFYPDDYWTIGYNATAIMDRDMAEHLQRYMEVNNTLFTDLMDEYVTESLIVRVE